jgi:pimeloyl-ACP methyl ester carboxylesterase
VSAAFSSTLPGAERHFFRSGEHSIYSSSRRGARADAPLVLFCNGFAQDHVFNWRAEVLGARILAARGYPTFSYHPRAHGDSSGDFESLKFADLVADAQAAAAEGLRRTGGSRIVWVGVRFGAMVAAAAMRKRSDTAAALALWEPAYRAQDYFRMLMRRVLFFELSRGRRSSLTVEKMVAELGAGRSVALLGFDLHTVFYRSALDVDLLEDLASWRGPTLIAQIQRRKELAREHLKLKTALEGRGAEVLTTLIDEEPNWDNGFEAAWTLEGLSQQMGEWLDGIA